ncbi:MAG: hypothetical protein MI921_22410 [Cytophagales bacterium]|nr:hypothetical protein [Cytophagales bacterium]
MRNIIELLIKYAIKAPSVHNTQPWRFAYRNNVIKVFPDYNRRLPMADQDDHALFISLGCAVENLVIAANHFGYRADIDYFPPLENNECIRIRLTEGRVDLDNRLFEAIDNRQSTRNRYKGRKIPGEDMKALQNAAHYEGVRTLVFSGQQEILPLIEFIKEASFLRFSNNSFKHELIYWIRFNTREAKQTGDGLYTASMGFPSVPSWLGRLIMRLIKPSGEAKRVEKLVKSSSAMMVFIAESNQKKNWINLGRAFERVALTATVLNIKHAHLNMPCEEIEVRKKLAAYLGLPDNQQPLLLIRLGYSEFMPYPFRRSIHRVTYEDKSPQTIELQESGIESTK